MSIKNCFTKITVASLVSLLLYIISNVLIRAIMSEAAEIGVIFANALFAVFVAALFAIVLIYFTYIRTGDGEDTLFRDYPGERKAVSSTQKVEGAKYAGIKNDIMPILRGEKNMLLTIFGINMFVWLFTNIDTLIFHKRTFSALFIIYAPLSMVGDTLPLWFGKILGYLIGAALACILYIAELLLYRRKIQKQL